MKKTIIILSILCFLLLSFIVLENIWFVKKTKRITEKANNILLKYNIKEPLYTQQFENRNKQVDELNNMIYNEDKEKVYKTIINKDTELLNECQNQKEILKISLEKTIEELENINKKKNELVLFMIAGISITKQYNIVPDIYVGLEYNRTLYSGKKIDFALGGGAAVKIYQDIGVAIKLNGIITYSIRKEYIGHYVMRTASNDSFQVMDLTRPRPDGCWFVDENISIQVRLLASGERITLDVYNE